MGNNDRRTERQTSLGFQPLKPKEYNYFDAPVKQEPDWRALYIQILGEQSKLAGAFRSILLNPERIEEVGDSINANLIRLQEAIADEIMRASLSKEMK